MTPDTETYRGTEYPAPGKWSLKWVEGDGIRWRYGDDTDARIFDGTSAQMWLHQNKSNPFDDGVHILQVNGDEVARIDEADVASEGELMRKIAHLLRDHAPDE